MQGFTGGQANALNSPLQKDTTVQSLNRAAGERHARLMELCNRLESFADRLEPQPRPAGSGTAEKGPPIQNDLQGINIRLAAFGETLDWFNTICDRLDRIA